MVTSQPSGDPQVIAIDYANQSFSAMVWFEERNRLAITIQPDKKVIVRAPDKHTLDEVKEKLLKRAPWILRQLDYFEQYHPIQPERKYISGETHYYLGRQYRLKVFAGEENSVKLVGRFFMVSTTKPGDQQTTRHMMEAWYSNHARALILQRVALFQAKIRELGAAEPVIKFRRMQKRWGSCTPSGVITFNTELVKAPIHCIDYVVLHELCHLIHPGHSQKFYRLLDLQMPDWKKRKERLEKVSLI